MSEYLLEVKDLKIYFPVHGGILRRKIGDVYAVDGVSFVVRPGETLGLVGESGCGKTTVGRGIIRLYRPTDGEVYFRDRKISEMSKTEIRKVRRDLQMIFQDPFESLNSRHTIGTILEEPFVIHENFPAQERRERVAELLRQVGMQPQSIHRFPHEFSGGQRQRIGIARAIALHPELIICDEPVSALDVSIQSQILNVLIDLQQKLNLSYVFIAHDLAVVKHVSDRIAVMYLGKIVETAEAQDIYEHPRHPYTRALLSAIPIPDPLAKQSKTPLSGDVPTPRHPPKGCRFHTRCPIAIERCRYEEPVLRPMDSGSHMAACHRAGE
ncbi:MAG: dipeptide ABC transporter ATP-binding protein [Desulfobacterales bacterium]